MRELGRPESNHVSDVSYLRTNDNISPLPMLFKTAKFQPRFPKEEESWGFLFRMKTCGSKESSQWLNLEQMLPADISPNHFDEVAIVLFSIIS